METKTEKPTQANFDQEALNYHAQGKPGKIEVISSKPCVTEKDLALAYSPGVAAPCKEIAKDPAKVYDYTAKGNLVAVISNGTAVLGLGNIGPAAGKPVMEGKGILFKQFAGIDVFDIEVAATDVDVFCNAVRVLEPTFGGINLEDIKAPECFEIEERLKKEMKIPVFHDDQHGTAIVSGAALLNAASITNRKMENVRIVVNGAGASANSCAKIFIALGARRENIIMCDSQGVIYKGRTVGMNKYKEFFAAETEARTLTQALQGADVFVGLSVAGALTPEMLKDMAKDPIIFAMANPEPEITPDKARAARPDAIIATGRSDYPNQVNNVLGFPSIFRGALDTRSTQINEEMKLAAVHALAQLAREDVPDNVSSSYGGKSFKFGREYLIPKPFDTRVLMRVAPAVAKAAMDSGVATRHIEDWHQYRETLEALQGPSKVFIRSAINRVHQNAAANGGKLPKIVFPEGTSTKVLKALATLVDEKICEPILLGYPERVKEKIATLDIPALKDVPVIHPSSYPKYFSYVEKLYANRQRKGINMREAERLMADPNYFAAMMVHMGEADGMVSGSSINYADAVKPVLQTVGVYKNAVPAGLNIVLLEDKFLLLADTTVNFNPTAEQCAQIALQAAKIVEYFGIQPRIAMLSYSNFSGADGTPKKMKRAAEIVKSMRPGLMVDGDMQADAAVNAEITERLFPFSDLKGGANILVFPNLESANITYKLIQQVGKVEVIGPFLTGVRRSANILQRTTTVDGIVNSVVFTALEAQFIKGVLKAREASNQAVQ
ncbi:NAD-binding malic protein [Bdellovibrio bacteriovorus]|uniref:NAD-binding malic protein n=1 Tax=Bdellovibrio bacteriovorus TaxID=959 RepID=A0A150WKC2_BDEBC|nr:NADP-dependent malic enzyme [Bdellovibrio bacteriovorus]KYG64156.1 NAD-binding malic protein [Bdellovibrio bacteriovorus]